MSDTVPEGAAAVVLNVTAVNPSGNGNVVVYPCGESQPNASNVNYAIGKTVANAVVAKIGTDFSVCIVNSAATNLIVDVSGYFSEASNLQALTPARVLDNRPTGQTIDDRYENFGLIPAGTTTHLQLAGRAGIPGDAYATSLNVTVLGSSGGGFVTVYPCGTGLPNASNVNLAVGRTLAALAVTRIGSKGEVCIYNSAATNLIVDVNGYYP